MTRDPSSGIRILDQTIDYADGAEDRVLEILRGAGDTSSLSDELAAQIDDWPTRYHLARERSNLLRPLSIDHRHSVLEIGAGTGAVSRYLGETGARVVALEGSLPRARAAAARCRDLDNVEVVCGALDAYKDPERFDLVCLIGVLEYAGLGVDGSTPERFLEAAARHLNPTGTLVLAIENQIGLKYLIGYDEDHLGRPWVGLEGYPDDTGVRTYARRQLEALVAGCGLGHQQWFYPFPDYKLPSIILSDATYDEEDAAAFIGQLVRHPAGGAADHSLPLVCDDHYVHRVMLSAGLGRDVANSFLVLASAAPEHLTGRPDPCAIAWLYGGQRRRRWIRHQVVENTDCGRRIRAHGPDDFEPPRTQDWLHQNPQKDDPFIVGTTLWEEAHDACRSRDPRALRRVLELWLRTIDRERTTAADLGNANPYLLGAGRDVLPADHLDICLSNFIVSNGDVDFVDREWIAEPAVDADLVSARALWLLAQGLAEGGGIHPWDPSLTVSELTVKLGDLAQLPVRDHLERIDEAEAELLHKVTGRDQGGILTDLQWLRTSRPTDPELLRSRPMSRLQQQLDAASVELTNLNVERGERARLERELAHERSAGENLSNELKASHERLAEMGGKLEEMAKINTRLAEMGGKLEEMAKINARLAEMGGKLKATGAALGRANSEIERLTERADQADRLEGQVVAGAQQLTALENEFTALQHRAAELESETAEGNRVADALRTERDVLRTERDTLNAWRDAFEARLPVRLWRRLQGGDDRRH